MRIYVDADAFPRAVAEVLFRAIERRRLPLILVTNKYVKAPQSELISTVTVAAGPDEADDRIVELVEPGELVITADIPLADRVVTKGAHAINPRGELYSQANIKQRLATRDLLSDLRDNGMITGGPAPFNQKNTQAFAEQLDRFLTKHCRQRRGEAS